jgi:hypothetical protein
VPDITLDAVPGGIIAMDTTPPEATIGFDGILHQLSVLGKDDTGSTTVIISATSSLVVDEMGNTLDILLKKGKSKARRITAAITSLSYNGIPVPIVPTTVQYKWATKKDGTYAMFAAYLKSGSTTLEAHYRPKKNITIFMQKTEELDDEDADDRCESRPIRFSRPGMVIPYLETRKGEVVIGY